MKTLGLAVALVVTMSLLASAPGVAAADDRRSSITGTAYFDANSNARPDPQERAIKNLQIDVEGPNGFRESKKTSDSGAYEFSGLSAGIYRLVVQVPSGYALTGGEVDREITVDGRSSAKFIDFGVVRAEQAPGSSAQQAPRTPAEPSPTSPSAAAVPPGWSPNSRYAPPTRPPGDSAAAAPGASSQSGAAPGGSAATGPRSAPSSRSQQRPPDPTTTPQPTAGRSSAMSAYPTIEPVAEGTPTRTPPPLESIQAGSERARAALVSAGDPRTASQRQGENVTLDVKFRTMWDETDYQDTNAGSAAIGMALDAYGYAVPSGDLRALANLLGRTFDVGQPPRIEMLVRVAELSSVKSTGLYEGIRLAIWSPDDVREKLRAGYPVLTLVRTDGPDTSGDLGRERYVLMVGLKDGGFLYHDPSYRDDRGALRFITDRNLQRSWASSSGSSEAAAFGLGQTQLGLFSPLEDLLQAQREPSKPTTSTMREVPTPGPVQPLGPLAQLVPVPQQEAETTTSSGPLPFGGIHPLFLAFIAVSGVILVRVVAGLLLE